jgi:ATP-binding cassette, subfamily B (MDR/TAP), member 1
MSSEKRDSPPSPSSNAEPTVAEKASSHNEVDEKDASSLALSDPSREKNETGQPAIVPVQPGPHEAAIALTKLDSTVQEKKDTQQDPFAHLPEHEASILRKQVETPDVKVGYLTLFRYATAFDWFVFVVSMFCAIVAGAAMPLMTVSVF